VTHATVRFKLQAESYDTLTTSLGAPAKTID